MTAELCLLAGAEQHVIVTSMFWLWHKLLKVKHVSECTSGNLKKKSALLFMQARKIVLMKNTADA